jgi:hypothetical protein
VDTYSASVDKDLLERWPVVVGSVRCNQIAAERDFPVLDIGFQ